MKREAVLPTPRAAMSLKRRAMILDAYGECCAMCREKLADAWIADHIIPLELGGADEFSNLQPLCVPCDRLKTPDDLKRIAKMRRQHAKDNGTFPETKAKLRSRGFQRTRPDLP